MDHCYGACVWKKCGRRGVVGVGEVVKVFRGNVKPRWRMRLSVCVANIVSFKDFPKTAVKA